MASTSARRSPRLGETLVVDDQRLTYVEGSVRRSVGPALVEVGGAYERGGGFAARASVLGQARAGQCQRRIDCRE